MSKTVALLSLIVPFRNAARYLRGAIEPLVACARTGEMELLFVDDGSEDDSRAIIENSFAGVATYRVLSSESRGPGPARNVGLAVAQGDYVAFLDADDVVDPKILLGLCSQMEQERADLAIFNHCRLYPDGSIRKNRRTDLLQRDCLVSDEAGKLMLLDNFNVAWNKIYRRSMIESFQIRFPEGIYEDIPWSISCLFGASKVITEPTIAYTYRQHPVSALKVIGAPHLVLPLQYERAIDFCIQHGCSTEWQEALVGRAVRHGLLIAYLRKRMGLRHRVRVFSDLLALIDKYEAGSLVQATDRLTNLQKLAFRMRSPGVLELRHFVARVVRLSRRVFRVTR